MNIKPLKRKVLIAENVMEVKSEFGIILDTAKSAADSKSGTVLAIGPDCKDVNIGDTVYVEWSKGSVVKVDNVMRLMIDEEHIALIVEKE